MPSTLQSSANIAANQLASIPFGSLLGEPLDAAVKAQAYAANTTADYIQSVGMQEDANGNLAAVNVRFFYQDANGATRILIVPLLILIPIPFLEITSLAVDFKAKITASGAISESQSSSESRRRSGYARARSGWFFDKFVKVRGGYSAGVSSKKDSVATQSSKYSVEYTMNVNMHAGQAGVPAGMSAVLSMLESALLDKPATPEIKIFGPDPLEVGPGETISIDVLVLDVDGSALSGQSVDLTTTGPTGAAGVMTITTSPGTTSPMGRATFQIKQDTAPLASPELWTFAAKSTIDGTLFSESVDVTATS